MLGLARLSRQPAGASPFGSPQPPKPLGIRVESRSKVVEEGGKLGVVLASRRRLDKRVDVPVVRRERQDRRRSVLPTGRGDVGDSPQEKLGDPLAVVEDQVAAEIRIELETLLHFRDRLAGLERVPVHIASHDDLTSFQIALVENIQREDLTPLEEAEAFQRLVQDYDQTQEEVAKRVGKDRSTVANALRLLQLPAAVKDALSAGQLSPGHCRALLSLPSTQIELVARQVIARGLSVRATEALARKAKQIRLP